MYRRYKAHSQGVKQQAEEALEIYERLNYLPGQARALRLITCSLLGDGQLDAAERVVTQVIVRFSGGGEEFQLSACHHVLGCVCDDRGETEKAIEHVQAAIAGSHILLQPRRAVYRQGQL